jgi:hypothetical protein
VGFETRNRTVAARGADSEKEENIFLHNFYKSMQGKQLHYYLLILI